MRLVSLLLLPAVALGCTKAESPPPQASEPSESTSKVTARQAFAPGDTEAVIRQGNTTITITRGPDIPYSTDSTLLRSLPDSSALLRALERQGELLTSDTIHFYSAEGLAGWAYEGSPLDTTFWKLYEFAYPELHIASKTFPELSVAGRVALAPSIMGYVLRVPGMYSTSELDLWLYDTSEQRFRGLLRVAEHWGDEGYVFNEETWLVRSSSSAPYRLFRRRWHTNADLDTDSITLNVDTLHTRAWQGRWFGDPEVVRDGTLRRVFVMARRGKPR